MKWNNEIFDATKFEALALQLQVQLNCFPERQSAEHDSPSRYSWFPLFGHLFFVLLMLQTPEG